MTRKIQGKAGYVLLPVLREERESTPIVPARTAMSHALAVCTAELRAPDRGGPPLILNDELSPRA